MENDIFFNKRLSKGLVLVAPLDWGIGHATRCIPIINELLEQNINVIIAAGGKSFFLLKKEFSSLVILRTFSYKINYAKKKKWLPFLLFLQLPAIFFSIIIDHFWLKKAICKFNIKVVISDNRIGLYNKKIFSVYITHQLMIKTGRSITETFFHKLHSFFIKKFDQCWVPDYEKNSLAGDLSRPIKIPSNVLYIGALSRFEKKENIQMKYDVLISLSGPEPQRTLFEKLILTQLKNIDKKFLLIRGLPDLKNEIEKNNDQIKIVNHLSTEELNIAFLQSNMVICRSGYTTIMDLIKLGKKATLIPTPGQTEQEYLAKYLMEKKIFFCVEQDLFCLDDALEKAKNFPFKNISYKMDHYKEAVKNLAASLNTISV